MRGSLYTLTWEERHGESTGRRSNKSHQSQSQTHLLPPQETTHQTPGDDGLGSPRGHRKHAQQLRLDFILVRPTQELWISWSRYVSSSCSCVKHHESPPCALLLLSLLHTLLAHKTLKTPKTKIALPPLPRILSIASSQPISLSFATKTILAPYCNPPPTTATPGLRRLQALNKRRYNIPSTWQHCHCFSTSKILRCYYAPTSDSQTQRPKKRKKTEREALKTSKQQTFSIPHCSALVPWPILQKSVSVESLWFREAEFSTLQPNSAFSSIVQSIEFLVSIGIRDLDSSSVCCGGRAEGRRGLKLTRG